MDGQYTSRDRAGRPAVVVVGAASRDVAGDDPRGWRLGGAVAYSALTTARLGLRTAALVGVDAAAASAHELDLLHDAGVDLRLVPLARSPVFVNLERRDGRVQHAREGSDAVPVRALPEAWRDAAGWILAPVAGELSADWAAVPREAAIVAVGWQGLLRELRPGEPVRRLRPDRHPLLSRADLVGLSRDDVDAAVPLAELYAALSPGATLAVTQGDRGGMVVDGVTAGSELRLRHYPAVRARVVDATGAGDVFLAALAAARMEPRLVGGRLDRGFDLLLAAAAASLVLEGAGLLGVASRDAIRARMAAGLRAAAPRERRGPTPSS